MSSETPTISEIAVNDLAFRTLNLVPLEPSETTAEALDHLSEQLRKVGLGITVGLLEIASAIREAGQEEHYVTIGEGFDENLSTIARSLTDLAAAHTGPWPQALARALADHGVGIE